MSERTKTLLSGSIANVFEWYDYALFGHFAGIIGTQFFPSDNPDAAFLRAFLVFAAGYLMRPVGGVLFGMIGDKLGRKVALSSAVICMAFPTMLIGLLPTYASIGITSTILMVMARMLQGLSMGGALTGSVCFMIEHSPKNRHGLVGSMPMAGICVGILMGSLVAGATRGILGVEEFHEWGWRLPFLMGFFILIAGFYIKKHTLETPQFNEVKNSGNVEKSPILKVIKNHWRDMLVTIGINCTGAVTFYIVAVYLPAYLGEREGGIFQYMSSICYVVMTFVTLLVGWLSDLFGRRRIAVVNIIALVALMPFMTSIIDANGSIYSILMAQLVISMLSAAYIGPEPALLTDLYPANVRSTALSISYNLSNTVFGGTTPYVMTLLVQGTGSMTSCIWYLYGCSIMSLVGLYFYKDRSLKITD